MLRALGGDPAVAATLGADVPFCLQGGFARVGGIGERLEPGEVPARFVVIATPPFGCATAEVYRAWDALGGPRDEHNDLRAAAEHVEPRLVGFRRDIEAAAGAPALLAGSGSSYAVVFAGGAEAEAARARVAAATPGPVWMGSTVPVGVELSP